MKHALLAALALVLLAAAPATARSTDQSAAPSTRQDHSVVLDDPAGDVFTYSEDSTGYHLAAFPAADVLQARIVHGRYAVAVRMVFDDLQRGNLAWYRCEIRTPGQPTSWFILEAGSGHWRGIGYQDVQGEWVRVRGFSHSIDYDSDVVTLRISRTLLGNPASVQVRLHNELGLPDHNTFYIDNPTTATAHPRFTVPLTSP